MRFSDDWPYSDPLPYSADYYAIYGDGPPPASKAYLDVCQEVWKAGMDMQEDDHTLLLYRWEKRDGIMTRVEVATFSATGATVEAIRQAVREYAETKRAATSVS